MKQQYCDSSSEFGGGDLLRYRYKASLDTFPDTYFSHLSKSLLPLYRICVVLFRKYVYFEIEAVSSF